MRRVADEHCFPLDDGGLQFHVQQIPESYAVVRSHVQQTEDRRGKVLESADELLLGRTLIIASRVCSHALPSG